MVADQDGVLAQRVARRAPVRHHLGELLTLDTEMPARQAEVSRLQHI